MVQETAFDEDHARVKFCRGVSVMFCWPLIRRETVGPFPLLFVFDDVQDAYWYEPDRIPSLQTRFSETHCWPAGTVAV